MKITEIFKTENEAVRREAVTKLLIHLENKKWKDAEVMKPAKAR